MQHMLKGKLKETQQLASQNSLSNNKSGFQWSSSSQTIMSSMDGQSPNSSRTEQWRSERVAASSWRLHCQIHRPRGLTTLKVCLHHLLWCTVKSLLAAHPYLCPSCFRGTVLTLYGMSHKLSSRDLSPIWDRLLFKNILCLCHMSCSSAGKVWCDGACPKQWRVTIQVPTGFAYIVWLSQSCKGSICGHPIGCLVLVTEERCWLSVPSFLSSSYALPVSEPAPKPDEWEATLHAPLQRWNSMLVWVQLPFYNSLSCPPTPTFYGQEHLGILRWIWRSASPAKHLLAHHDLHPPHFWWVLEACSMQLSLCWRRAARAPQPLARRLRPSAIPFLLWNMNGRIWTTLLTRVKTAPPSKDWEGGLHDDAVMQRRVCQTKICSL